MTSPDHTDPYRVGQPAGPAVDRCELCGKPLTGLEVAVCQPCCSAYPTVAEALRSDANDAAR